MKLSFVVLTSLVAATAIALVIHTRKQQEAAPLDRNVGASTHNYNVVAAQPYQPTEHSSATEPAFRPSSEDAPGGHQQNSKLKESNVGIDKTKQDAVEWAIKVKNASTVKTQALVQGQTFEGLIEVFMGDLRSNNKVPDAYLDKLNIDYEQKIAQTLNDILLAEFSSEELHELRSLGENTVLSAVSEARNEYQQNLIHMRDSTAAQQSHQKAMEAKPSEARAQLIHKLDDLLGETKYSMKQGTLMSQLMMGQEPDLNAEIPPAAAEQFGEFNFKALVAQYNGVADHELAEYVTLLEKNEVLVKEHKAVQQSVLTTTNDVFQTVRQIKRSLENGEG